MATFVTQTHQSLLSDPQEALGDLLVELIAVQRAAANGSAVNNVPFSRSMATPFVPSSSDVWINSLLFASLVLSLLTAFIGVLAKQWLYQYITVASGSPQDRALVRQARALGLQEWHVPMLIAALPVILHISLALFFAGLVVLLHSILREVAYLATSLVCLVYLAYMISTVLPIVYPRCPYRTGLTPKIYRLCRPMLSRPLRGAETLKFYDAASIGDGLPTSSTHPGRSSTYRSLVTFWTHLASRVHWVLSIRITHVKKPRLWRDAERADALKMKDLLEAKALSWLHTSSYNPTAQQIVFEALGALQPSHYNEKRNWDSGVVLSLTEELRRCCERLCDSSQAADWDVGKQMGLYLKVTILLWPFISPERRWLKSHVARGSDDVYYVHQHTSLLAGILIDGASFPNITKLKELFSYHGSPKHSLSKACHFQVLLAMLKASQHADEHNFGKTMWTVWKDLHPISGHNTALLLDSVSAYIRTPPHCGHRTSNREELGIERRLSKSVAALSHDGKLSILLRRLLFLVAWNEYHDSSEQFVWDEIDMLLDGILRNQHYEAVTRQEEEGAKQILVYFVCTKTFTRCASRGTIVQSAQQPEIVQKTAQLLDDMVIFYRVMASTSSCVILAIFLVTWELATETEKKTSGFFSRQRTLAFLLYTSFAGAEKPQLYEAMIELDAMPRLHVLWIQQDHSLSSVPLAYIVSTIAVFYVKSICMEDVRQIAYIHLADNLYSLCEMILGGVLWDDATFDDAVILRLTSMKPEHPSWVECYERLCFTDWTRFSDEKLSLGIPQKIRNAMEFIRSNAERAQVCFSELAELRYYMFECEEAISEEG